MMEVPNEITGALLDVVVMPNGEVICNGKSLGWVSTLGKYLTPKVAEPQTSAPWTIAQVAALNRWQTAGHGQTAVHPFTCPEIHMDGGDRVLVAQQDGWHCPTCDYTQGWAHAFMLTDPGVPR